MIVQRWRIQKLDVTGSTNDNMRRAAEAGEAQGLVIVANCQTGGKGRQGRVWESPEGNLYCSILLRPQDLLKNLGWYSFVAGLAVRDVIAEFLMKVTQISRPLEGGGGTLGNVLQNLNQNSRPLPPLPNPPHKGEGITSLSRQGITLKWPNDVLVSGKKISGILLEVAGEALIIGIGLNIAHHPENTLYPATSLKDEGAVNADASEVLTKLLWHLGSCHDKLQTEGFAPIRDEWLRHAQTGRMTVKLPKETLQGEFAGIDENGHLRLRLEGGAERVISTGDVFLNVKD